MSKCHAEEVCAIATVPDKRQQIIVRRKHIWSDAKRALRRAGFNYSIGLNVQFTGEDAHNAGGPSREFFRLVSKHMSEDGSLFAGPSTEQTLVHNVLKRLPYCWSFNSTILDLWWSFFSLLFLICCRLFVK